MNSAELLAPPQLLARFRVLADHRIHFKWIDHHVQIPAVRHGGEDPATNPKRWIAPVLLLNCLWQRQRQFPNLLDGHVSIMATAKHAAAPAPSMTLGRAQVLT